MKSHRNDLGASQRAKVDSEDPVRIPSTFFTLFVFLSLFLSLGAIALLCAEHYVTVLERHLDAPAELP